MKKTDLTDWVENNPTQTIQTALFLTLICTVVWLAIGTQQIAKELTKTQESILKIEKNTRHLNASVYLDLPAVEFELRSIATILETIEVFYQTHRTSF